MRKASPSPRTLKNRQPPVHPFLLSRHFQMPSRRDAIPGTLRRILRAAAPARLGEERTSDLAVVASEALSNAAIHGNQLNPELEVQVVVSVDRRRVVIEVEDAGPGFDRSILGDPTHPERLLATGGRGVYLMRRLVDRLEYNHAGNRVRLIMFRHPPVRHSTGA